MKSLVVYFSRPYENYFQGQIKYIEKGNTKVVAEKIKEITHSDIFEIQPLHDYPSDYHKCTRLAQLELSAQDRPKIANLLSHIEEYDTIYLGFPNWWGTMPMIVWTFLESYHFINKHIYPFCTHEGSGFGQSLEDLQKLCPLSTIHKGLSIFGHLSSTVMKK